MSVLDTIARSYANHKINLPEDEDELNKYVADLILKDSLLKDKQFNRDGISAYNTSQTELPKTNKRFLAAVVQSTNNHNRELIQKTRDSCERKLRHLNSKSYETDNRRKRKKQRRRHDSESPRRQSSHSKNLKRKDRKNDHKSNVTLEERSDVDHYESPDDKYRINSEITSTVDSEHPSPNASLLNRTAKPKGRGTIGSMRLDKFFEPEYDPKLDIDNYDDTNFQFYLQSLENEIDIATLEKMERKRKLKLYDGNDEVTEDKKRKKDKKKRSKKDKQDVSDKNLKTKGKSKKHKRGGETSDSDLQESSDSSVFGPQFYLAGSLSCEKIKDKTTEPRGPEQCPW
ncbi:hypothetical protein HK096_003333 [Nowakowskiella sp. JEL0078]|nr:hypothetical protein HK096_003333 [Nowakowskiella sp. JEL0078]